jgi:uncharacterized membrane protein
MKTRLINFWEMLRASYWFLPTLMAGGAILLAPAVIALDEALQYEATEGVVWIYTGGPEGARTLLSTVAGSMITVAGVTFP